VSVRAGEVIGQNGVGLIRGPNRLGSLERVDGQPSSLHAGRASCTASWRPIGLVATFAGGRCVGVLTTATVTGARWCTLNGGWIGDPVAEMEWREPEVKPISAHRWLLVSRGRERTSRLLASAGAGGRISSFSVAIG
jgi:hypothetical protein